jgi:hypothetical protein
MSGQRVEVRGFIGRDGNGNLAFFAASRATGVPLTAGPKVLRDAIYAAEPRDVGLGALAALDPRP